MNLFGLEPYLGALLIAIIGIAAATVFGWLSKEKGSFNLRKVAASVVIGFPASIIFVSTELQVMTIPEDGGLTAIIIVAALIAQVAGFDFLVKTGVKAIKSK